MLSRLVSQSKGLQIVEKWKLNRFDRRSSREIQATEHETWARDVTFAFAARLKRRQ